MPVPSILILDPGNFTPYYDANLCGGLANLGLEVEWVTSPYLFEPITPPPDVQVQHAFFTLLDRPPFDGIPALRQMSWLRRALKAASYPWEMWSLSRKLEQRPPGVAHVQWSLFPLLDGTLYRRWRQKGWRLIYTVHDVLPNGHGRWHPHLPVRAQYRYLYNSVDMVIAHSESNRQALLELGISPERIKVLPLGDWGYFSTPTLPHQEARARLGLDPDRPLALFFGLIKPHKGLHLLVESLAEMLAHAPTAQVLVAGEPMESLAPYFRQIAALNLQNVVTCHPRYIPTSEVATYFSAADVVVLPYLDITLSAVLVTAYSFGRPVVATAVGGLPELIEQGKSGMIVPPEDPDALGRVLGQLLADPTRCQMMGNYAHRLARERHDWSTIAQQTADLYRHVWQNGHATNVWPTAAVG